MQRAPDPPGGAGDRTWAADPGGHLPHEPDNGLCAEQKLADLLHVLGIGTNMPSNVTYGLDTDNLTMRYHPERNFDKIGRAMMPINQDAVVQYIGFMGELTMTNPLFQWKFYDSNPSA